MVGFLAVVSPVFADEVSDQIGAAQKAYQAGDMSAAQTALDTAKVFLNQKIGDAIMKVIPAPLEGWTMERSKSGGVAMVGMSVSKRFRKGNKDVRISILSNSPMLQSMGMMFSNPAMLGGDNRLVMIGDMRAIYDGRKNSYQAMVEGKALVSVDGSDDVSEDTLKTYMTKINFAELKKLVK